MQKKLLLLFIFVTIVLSAKPKHKKNDESEQKIEVNVDGSNNMMESEILTPYRLLLDQYFNATTKAKRNEVMDKIIEENRVKSVNKLRIKLIAKLLIDQSNSKTNTENQNTDNQNNENPIVTLTPIECIQTVMNKMTEICGNSIYFKAKEKHIRRACETYTGTVDDIIEIINSVCA